MINIIRTKLLNKSDKTFLYRLSDRNITLTPNATVVLDGDLFSKETSQDGVTENILVAAYNGELEITLIVDNDFISAVNRDSVVRLPVRSQVRLKNKSEAPKVEAKKEEKPVVAVKKEEKPVVEPVEAKSEVKVETKKVDTKKTETKKVEALKDVKLNDTKVEKL